MEANIGTVTCGQPAAVAGEWKTRPARRSLNAWALLAGQGLLVLGMLVASHFFFSHFVVQSMRVSGTSMTPTLRDAEFYLVNRATCLFRAPKRGEIVVLKDPTDQSYAVKRVIGQAGDTVELRDGKIFVNGERLDETYLPKDLRTYPYTTARQTVHCGDDQFFVLGDNRSLSSDSRCYGPVARSAILGLVIR